MFLCIHNAGRSQMALGFLGSTPATRPLAGPGLEPGHQVNPAAVAAMAERGIDIAGEFPKPWTDEIVRAADVVITMGCGDACPIFPGKRYEEWDLDDPRPRVDAVRPIRDDIERRVLTARPSSTSRRPPPHDTPPSRYPPGRLRLPQERRSLRHLPSPHRALCRRSRRGGLGRHRAR